MSRRAAHDGVRVAAVTGYHPADRENLRLLILELLTEQRHMLSKVLRGWFPKEDAIELDMAIISLINAGQLRLEDDEYHLVEKNCIACGESKSPLAFQRAFSGNLYAKCIKCVGLQISATRKRRREILNAPRLGVTTDNPRTVAIQQLMAQYSAGLDMLRQQMAHNDKLWGEIQELRSEFA